MTQQAFITGALFTGAVGFLYLYHVFPRRFDAEQREQVSNFRWYDAIDWVLKIGSLLAPLASLYWRRDWLLLVHDSAAARWAGLAVAACGFGLFVWSILTLSDQYSPCNAARLPSRLVETGPYRWIRHPIYSANLVLLTGLTVLSGSVWLAIGVGVLAACYWRITSLEEATLRGRVPGYQEYARRRGRFWPRWGEA